MRKLLKINTKEKFTAVIFMLIIFLMFAGMLINPLAITGEFINTYRANVPTGAPALDRVKGAISALDSSINAGVPAKSGFVELYGLAQLAMDKKVVADYNYGALYKTPYGQIAHTVPDVYTDKYLANMYDLVNSLVSAKIPFLYVQAPFKLPDADSQVPGTVKDYSNENADRFIASLTAANIDCFDLRPSLWNSGMSQNQLFYDTDHHWTIDAAFFATGRIVNILNTDYGFNINESLYDISNYEKKTYKDFFVGSMGRRVGQIYGGIDDFTLITPKFETSFSLLEDGINLYEGSFYDAILKKEYLDEKAPLDTNRYAVYHGDNAELIFENKIIGEGKILIIKDSFGLPVYSFLSLGLHAVRAIDVRLFKEDVAEYAARYGPDIVIILYNADCFSDAMFDFNKK
jgi:hypothetical protein